MDFDPRQLPREFYDDKIRQLTERAETDRQRLHTTMRELDWWRQARALFAPPDESAAAAAPVVPANPGRPMSLRDLILTVFLERPSESFRPADVIATLGERGWLPTARTAPQMVRNRMLSMVDSGVLVRDNGGSYGLEATLLRLAVEGVAGSLPPTSPKPVDREQPDPPPTELAARLARLGPFGNVDNP